MNSPTRDISRLLAGLKYEDIPDEAIEQAKKLTLHVLAASFGSLPVKQTQSAIRMTEKKGGIEEATIWGGTGKKVPAEEAAFANGTICDVMDWEDCSWTGHPSAGTFPAAFAMTEARGKSGKDYLLAVVASYEGYQRIAMAVQPTDDYVDSGQGWGMISWQVFASSLAAAKVMDFNEDQFDQTIGASVYQAIVCTDKHSTGGAKSNLYHYVHGLIARNGVKAALLTEDGFENCYGCLDGFDGYWALVSDQEDPTWYTKDWGNRWLICDTYLKHWPTNMWIQTPLEILDSIAKEHPINPECIEEMWVDPYIPFCCNDYAESTRSILDAQFNVPYCLAAYVFNNQMGAEWFSEKYRNDPAIIDFAHNIKFSERERSPMQNFAEFQTGSFPEATIRIKFTDGVTIERTLRYPKGHHENNFTMQEECDHFRMACAPYLPKEQVESIIEKVMNLENEKKLDELAALTVVRRDS